MTIEEALDAYDAAEVDANIALGVYRDEGASPEKAAELRNSMRTLAGAAIHLADALDQILS